MDIFHQLIGFCSDDGAGRDNFPLIFPFSPQSGKGEQPLAVKMNLVRLFLSPFLFLLIESIGRDQAAPLFQQ